MGLARKQSIEKNHLQYNYSLFDGVRSFNQFVDQEQLTTNNLGIWETLLINAEGDIAEGTEFYGEPQPKGLEELEKHDRFLGMELVQKIRPLVTRHLHQYLDKQSNNLVKLPRLAYNDRGLGVFSFERAAMGMNLQHKINLSTRQNLLHSQLGVELNHRRPTTDTKKVFAHFDNKHVALPSIRIYIMAGAPAYITGSEMLYVGLACGELVEFLERRGVPVEVNVIIGAAYNGAVNMAVVTVKQFRNKLDKNQLLLMSSDPRYFRHRGFKAIISIYNHFGIQAPSYLGELTEDMGQKFVSLLDPYAFVFEQKYSLDEAVSEVIKLLEEYEKKRTTI